MTISSNVGAECLEIKSICFITLFITLYQTSHRPHTLDNAIDPQLSRTTVHSFAVDYPMTISSNVGAECLKIQSI